MNTKVLVIGCSVLSAAAGAVAGYFACREQIKLHLEEEYTRMLAEEVEATKQHYAMRNKVGEFASPVDVLARRTPQRPEGIAEDDNEVWENNRDNPLDKAGIEGAERIIKGLKYNDGEQSEEPQRFGPPDVPVQSARPRLNKGPQGGPYPKPNNVFVAIPPDDPSDPTVPYLILEAEFAAGLLGHDHGSFTLYSDGMLVDENEEPLDDVNATVGLDNLQKFGHEGSDDPDTIYVRNERLGLDFEIHRNAITYAEVIGLSEPPSSSKRSRRR